MIDYFSEKITKFVVVNEYNQNDDTSEEIIFFGSKILVATMLNWFIILLISWISIGVLKSITFLLFYSIVRGLSGGYHASNMNRCLLMSISIFMMTFLAEEYLKEGIVYLRYILVFLFPIFIKCAPLGTIQNTIPKAIVNRRKVKLSIIMFFLWGATHFMVEDLAYYGISGLLWCELLLVAGVIQIKRRSKK